MSYRRARHHQLMEYVDCCHVPLGECVDINAVDGLGFSIGGDLGKLIKKTRGVTDKLGGKAVGEAWEGVSDVAYSAGKRIVGREGWAAFAQKAGAVVAATVIGSPIAGAAVWAAQYGSEAYAREKMRDVKDDFKKAEQTIKAAEVETAAAEEERRKAEATKEDARKKIEEILARRKEIENTKIAAAGETALTHSARPSTVEAKSVKIIVATSVMALAGLALLIPRRKK